MNEALAEAQQEEGEAGRQARRVAKLVPLLRQRSELLDTAHEELDQVRSERDNLRGRTRTLSAQLEASFRISEDLQQQTIASLASSGFEVSAEDIFDLSLLDEVYEENPELVDAR